MWRSKGPSLKRMRSWGSCTFQGRKKVRSKWLILDFPPHFGRWRFKLVLIKSEKIKKCARHYDKYWTHIWTYRWSTKHSFEDTAFHGSCILQWENWSLKEFSNLSPAGKWQCPHSNWAAPKGITTWPHCLALPGLIPQVIHFRACRQAQQATLWTSSPGTNWRTFVKILVLWLEEK